MAGASTTIRIDGEETIERKLASIEARIDDLMPFLDIVGQYVESDIEDNFEGEHSPDGVAWAKRKYPKEGDPKILHGRPPRLRPSISRHVTARSVEVGTNVPYARRHQLGFTGTEQVKSHKRRIRYAFGVRLAAPIEVIVAAHARRANTPARPFLGISAGAQADILGEGDDYLAGLA